MTLAAAITVALAGCGNADEDRSRLRPPAVIGISGFAGNGKIVVDPDRFGAGPLRLVMTNQTDKHLVLTVRGDRVEQTLDIGPRGTVDSKFNLDPGDYTVLAEGTNLEPAQLSVGPKRKSAQHDLLQP